LHPFKKLLQRKRNNQHSGETTTECEKVVVKCSFDKELIFSLYKELNPKIKQTSNLIKKWGADLIDTFQKQNKTK
jgi:hypothetical protein